MRGRSRRVVLQLWRQARTEFAYVLFLLARNASSHPTASQRWGPNGSDGCVQQSQRTIAPLLGEYERRGICRSVHEVGGEGCCRRPHLAIDPTTQVARMSERR